MRHYDKAMHIVGTSPGLPAASPQPDSAFEDRAICARHFASVRSPTEFFQVKLEP